MLIFTRAQQYRKFWQDLYHLLSTGMHLSLALETIANKLAGSPDKFDRGIVKMVKAVKKVKSYSIKGSQPGLSDLMKDTGLFSDVEISIIRGTEVSHPMVGPNSEEWKNAIRLLMGNGLATVANQYTYFYQTFGALLGSGVPMLVAVRISSNGLSGPLVPAVELIGQTLKEGGYIYQGMYRSKVFTNYEIAQVTAGEALQKPAHALLSLSSDCHL